MVNIAELKAKLRTRAHGRLPYHNNLYWTLFYLICIAMFFIGTQDRPLWIRTTIIILLVILPARLRYYKRRKVKTLIYYLVAAVVASLILAIKVSEFFLFLIIFLAAAYLIGYLFKIDIFDIS